MLAALLLALPAQAQSQSAADDRVAEMIANAQRVLSAVPPKPTCAQSSGDEIVVCAREDSSRYRVPSTADSDPASRAALRTGMPAPPKLDRPSCKGQPNCLVGGYVPPPIYYIDLKAIPEAPEGSDADLVAKGEKAAR
ncbi:MAG: hypothetical protein ACKOQ3_02870 [Novosphingobium sp.]